MHQTTTDFISLRSELETLHGQELDQLQSAIAGIAVISWDVSEIEIDAPSDPTGDFVVQPFTETQASRLEVDFIDTNFSVDSHKPIACQVADGLRELISHLEAVAHRVEMIADE